MIEKKLKPDYYSVQSARTVKTGRLFSIGAIFILSLFAIKDHFVLHRLDFLILHLVGIAFYSFYLLLLYMYFEKNRKYIKSFHGISLWFVMIMISVIVYFSFYIGEPDEKLKIGATSALGICMFSVYIMAAVHKKNTYLITSVPFLALIAFLMAGSRPLTLDDISYFCNPGTILIIVSIMGFVGDREFKKDFLRKKKIEYYQKELEKENDEIKRLNSKLTKEIKKGEKLQKKLEQRASIDNLTGVFNRREGFRKLKHDIEISDRSGSEITLCFIDLDNLKEVNDNFGHRTGDKYIKKIVDAVKECIRTSDYIMRFGGDEFVIIFNNCKLEDAKLVISRVRNILSQEIENSNYQYSFSEGYSGLQNLKEKTAENLIKAADIEMYKNKNLKKSVCKN